MIVHTEALCNNHSDGYLSIITIALTVVLHLLSEIGIQYAQYLLRFFVPILE